MDKKKREALSKLLSFVLRHDPAKFEVVLDEQGFADISELLKAVSTRYPEIGRKNLEEAVKEDSKGRFEIKGNKIRARYGHSFKVKQDTPEVEPPSLLYHGTSPDYLENIKKQGLLPMKRHYVHLSKSRADAARVGGRKTKAPVILKIKAQEGWSKGVKFIKEGEVYLTEAIPPPFISLEKDEKATLRGKIWRTLEDTNTASFPRPCYGRIPNFVGSEKACQKLKELPEFKKASAIFTAPDFVLKRAREIILEEGKTLVVALPHMSHFVVIKERERIDKATSIRGFKKFGQSLKDTKVDLFVQGSVCVDKYGNRLGKGTGYGDKEWQYLKNKKLLSEETKVITLVHDLQLVEDVSSLMDPHDKRVDYIITPDNIIKTPYS